jgi:hypothetical protein
MKEFKFLAGYGADNPAIAKTLEKLVDEGWRIAYEQFATDEVGDTTWSARLERDKPEEPLGRPRLAVGATAPDTPRFDIGERVLINDEDWTSGTVTNVQFVPTFEIYEYFVEDTDGGGAWIAEYQLDRMEQSETHSQQAALFEVDEECFIDDEEMTSATVKRIDSDAGGYTYLLIDAYGDARIVGENDLIKGETK